MEFIQINIGSTKLKARPENESKLRDELAKASKIPSLAQVQAWALRRRDRREYPAYKDGMTTAEYVKNYYAANIETFAGWTLGKERQNKAADLVSEFFSPLSSGTKQADFLLSGGGSLYVLTPMSEQSTEWIDKHIDPSAQSFGGGIAVEHRYIQDIVEGIKNDGMSVH